jgi:hypothetical protein
MLVFFGLRPGENSNNINTLMIQRVPSEPDWAQCMLPDDLRALTPLG